MESLREDSAADLLPAHNGSLTMTKEELIERALREVGIFPPSVTDSHYADKTEMTRAEIILRSLDEMGMLSLSAQDPEFAEKIRCIQLVVAGLQLRLPDADITVCGAFSALNVGCCNACHSDPLGEDEARRAALLRLGLAVLHRGCGKLPRASSDIP
jgi:hypothetical protein